jgi:adenylate cyclase
VCVSGKVFDELEGKLPLPFEDRGEQRLKNIARPIRVYALKGGDVSPREPQAARPSQKVADRPSIAVLPFTNLSGDPEQEYLVEGIADDILTALSKSRWLFVMARSSSFAFKGRAMETDQIAQRLGVRYILSGSVRRSDTRLRISVQLVEGETGGSIWAERYDRNLTDIFALQDEISEAVAGAIEPELLRKEGHRGSERSQSSTAWDLLWARKVSDGEDKTRVHTGVQTGDGGALGRKRSPSGRDRRGARRPALSAAAVPLRVRTPSQPVGLKAMRLAG